MDVVTSAEPFSERSNGRARYAHEPGEHGTGADVGAVALAATAAALVGLGLLRSGRSWPLMVAGVGVGAIGMRRWLQTPTDQGVRVAKAVTIDRPRNEVYRAWHDFERLPRVLRHIERVQWLDDGRIRWTARLAEHTPAVTWTAEIIEDRENELIHWRSVPGSLVHNEGVVMFVDAPGNRGTELHARLSYRPGAAPGGRNVARAFRPLVSREIRQDLRRFKQLIETGEVATARTQPAPTMRGEA